MVTIQKEYANYRKVCLVEGCDKVAGEHMYYDTTLCDDHALDDECNRVVPKELGVITLEDKNE